MPSRCRSSNRRRSFFPFQRLLIVHQELVEACTGRGLCEGASLEELSEPILYYYDNSCQAGGVDDSLALSGRSYATTEAVHFAGLCSALHSLPSSLVMASIENDVARHVHLAAATLVFVPLERSILAVAQVPRSSPGPDGGDGQLGGGNTLAIQTSIQRCHDLFCLIRGGIHHRLSLGSHFALETKECSHQPVHLLLESDHCVEESVIEASGGRQPKIVVYPGMSTLFSLRRRKRCLLEEFSKLTSSLEQKKAVLEKEIDKVDEEIKTLLYLLPIQSLREELRIHYDEYISELESVTSTGGVAGRCIVEQIPVPTRSNPCAQLHHYPLSTPSENTMILLRHSMERLLINEDRNHCDEMPCLLGVSSFCNDLFLFSRVLPYVSTEEQVVTKASDEHVHLSISPQTATLLHCYMTSFRSKVSQHVNSYSAAASPTSTPPRLNNQVSHLGSFASDGFEDKAATSTNMADCSRGEETISIGSFLEPPPLSMLSASDQIFEVRVPSLGHSPVWTPRIHLPCDCARAVRPHGHGLIETHVALYEGGCFSFLLYIKSVRKSASVRDTLMDNGGPILDDSIRLEQTGRNYIDGTNSKQNSSQDVSLSSAYPLLEDISGHLSSCTQALMKEASDSQGDNMMNPSSSPLRGQEPKWDEPGQDVVFVDRNEHRLTLITNRDVVPTRTQNGDRRVKRLSMNFLGIKRNSGQEAVSRNASSRGSDISRTQWPPLRLDCRHILASHLPLDAILAFDDVMNEVHHLSQNEDRHKMSKKKGEERGRSPQRRPAQSQDVRDGTLEICTFLPQGCGWMFAHAHNERELYILFDNDVYVTIADVQNAALRVRRKLFEHDL